jgi:hypothetical protein
LFPDITNLCTLNQTYDEEVVFCGLKLKMMPNETKIGTKFLNCDQEHHHQDQNHDHQDHSGSSNGRQITLNNCSVVLEGKV